jgi:hypothetical protein
MHNKFILGIMLLILSLVMPAGAGEKSDVKAGGKSGVSAVNKDKESLCKKVASMIKDGTIDKYVPDTEHFDPRGVKYLNLDIDGDGRADKVIVSSGEEGSYLEVDMSVGSKYDIDESGFIMVVRIKKQIYALVTYWEWDRRPDGSKVGKKVANRLYKLTKSEAEIVCDIKDLKGGK